MSRAGTVLAWVALVCFVVAMALAVWPVQNRRGEVDPQATAAARKRSGDQGAIVLKEGPKVLQDCGAPAAFAATGRTQPHYGGGSGRLQKELNRYANEHSCTTRVAARLIPAAGLVMAATTLAVVGALLTWRGHRRLRRHGPSARAPADTAVSSS